MFDKDTLNDLAETIVYVNLLLAILAVIALYDQQSAREADDVAAEARRSLLERRLEELQQRIEAVEAQLAALH